MQYPEGPGATSMARAQGAQRHWACRDAGCLVWGGPIRAGLDDASTGGDRCQPDDGPGARPGRATPWAYGALGSDSTSGALGGVAEWSSVPMGGAILLVPGMRTSHVIPRGPARCSPCATKPSPRIEASERRERHEVGGAELVKPTAARSAPEAPLTEPVLP